MRWLWIVSICLFGSATLAAPLDRFEVLDDPTGDLTIDSVVSRTGWSQESPKFAFGYGKRAVWARFEVPSDAEIMAIDWGWNDKTETYFLSRGEVVESYLTGLHYPFDNRPVKDPLLAFPVPAGVDEVFIRHSGSSSGLYPIELMSRAEFERASATSLLLRGSFYGVLLIVLIYNLVLVFALRERFFAYFAGYILCLAMVLMTSDGVGAHVFAASSPRFLDAGIPLAITSSSIFLCLFAMRFMNLPSHLPRMTLVLTGYLVLLGVLGVVSMVRGDLDALGTMTTLITAVWLFGIGVVRWYQGNAFAPVFVFATGSALVGVMCVLFLTLGLVPGTLPIRNAIQIGSMIEIVVLAAALSTWLRDERMRQEATRSRSFELARRVRELQTASELATAHRELQRSIQTAHKLKTIGQLSGGFAHEFNNILASILGFTELAREYVTESKAAEYLGEVERASIRAGDLVKRVLSYSRRGSAEQPREINLGDALQESVALLRGTLPATVNITTDIPEGVRITTTPDQLRDALVNLCVNASEAMNERGQIRIGLEERDAKEVTCSSCLSIFSGPHWVVKVEDEGTGLDAQTEDLFAPFYTTKPTGQGSGLGLSIVHGIAHECGGHVVASNRARGGARFSLFFPLSHPAPAREPVATDKRRILLIEDDASVGRYLEALLDENAFDVTLANLPTAALETFMAMPETFDLVITDQQMPILTGLEIARDIHQLRPEVPIILTSGNPTQFDIAELAGVGIRDIFGKPIEAERLLARITGLLKTAA